MVTTTAVRTAELAGESRSLDRIVSGDRFIAILDGATPFRPTPVDAAIYVDALADSLRVRLAEADSADLPHVLGEAIREVATALQLEPGNSPSSTVAIFRYRLDGADALVLGDSLLAVPGEVLVDDRLDGVATDLRRAYRERLARGAGRDDTHRQLMRELQEAEAEQRNRWGGYWIAEAEPAAAVHAIPRTWSIAPSWAVLATDGAYQSMAALGLDDWPSVATADDHELAELLRRCHSWEANADGSHVPRAKIHDDKSLAVIACA